MSLRNALHEDEACKECGFLLWEPIATSTHSKLGLYNDDRFPGRCILELAEHRSSLEDLPMDSMLGFLRDIQVAMNAIRKATGAARVNVSILGNRDPHLHAHLVPRFPAVEQFPDCSPWNDLRTKGTIPSDESLKIKRSILEHIQVVDTRHKEHPALSPEVLSDLIEDGDFLIPT